MQIHYKFNSVKFQITIVISNIVNDYYKNSGTLISTSGFVQQRNKVKSEAFQILLSEFNKNCCDLKRYRGYNLYAVDGTNISIYRNPNSDSYVVNTENGKGYNLLQLTALYDLENRVRVDCNMRPICKQNEHKALYEMLNRNKIKK